MQIKSSSGWWLTADGRRMNPDEPPAACTLDDQALALPAGHQLPAMAPNVHARCGRRVRFTHDLTSFVHGVDFSQVQDAKDTAK
jgi:hypothetical protein